MRGVVIPSEHGGWGLTLEPVVLGLLLAAAHLASVTLDQAQQETTLIEDTFTKPTSGK